MPARRNIEMEETPVEKHNFLVNNNLKSLKDYIKLISLSWDKALLSFSLKSYAFIEIDCVCREKSFKLKTEEAGSLGRIEVKGLQADTDYRLTVRWERSKALINFKTLPAPVGKLISSFAAIADPHVSEKKENRKGRLFVESGMILQSVIDECNARELDFILIAGDLTNNATKWEYDEVKNILKNSKCPVLSVPGDHDVADNGIRRWRSSFGREQWCRRIKEYHIAGINTGRNSIDAEGQGFLEEIAGSKAFPLVLTHSLLFHNPFIKHGSKCKAVESCEKAKKSLDGIRAVPSIIYAGHQNIPSRVSEASAVQVSIPQISQYICGYYTVKHFKNGFYHFFTPVKSEILRQYSRAASDMAVDFYGEKQWLSSYREGADIYQSNFII